jgi:PPP family 3-phenylpropionic acid transporter
MNTHKPLPESGAPVSLRRAENPLPTVLDETVLRSFSFVYYMTMSLTVTYFPLYFDAQGYSKLQIGALYSIGPLIGIFANLFWGFLSDKYQTVRKLLIVILTCQLLTVVALNGIDSLGWLYVLMTLFYFCHMPITPLNDSLILLTVSRTGKSYASFRVFGSLGFASAALLFGLLLRRIGVEYTMWLTATTVGLSLALSFRLKDRAGSGARMDFSGVRRVIANPRFLWFLAFLFLLSFAHRTNDGFLTLYLRELGADDTLVGWSWMASALSEIPTFLFLSKYGHRYKELPLLMIAGIAYAVRFFLVSVVDRPEWVIALQLMHSCSFGIFLVTSLRYIQRLVPDEFRATGQAVFAVTWSCLAGLASGVAGGSIYELWGGPVMYRAAALSALLGAAGFLATHLWLTRRDEV